MAGPEAGIKGGLADADADHVALAGVHDAFNAVEEVVDLPLHDRLEVRLHGFAGHLGNDVKLILEPAGNSSKSGPSSRMA